MHYCETGWSTHSHRVLLMPFHHLTSMRAGGIATMTTAKWVAGQLAKTRGWNTSTFWAGKHIFKFLDTTKKNSEVFRILSEQMKYIKVQVRIVHTDRSSFCTHCQVVICSSCCEQPVPGIKQNHAKIDLSWAISASLYCFTSQCRGKNAPSLQSMKLKAPSEAWRALSRVSQWPGSHLNVRWIWIDGVTKPKRSRCN